MLSEDDSEFNRDELADEGNEGEEKAPDDKKEIVKKWL